MAHIEDILVPDIGGADDVEVIEILVKPGDQLQEEDSIITLEGDKATMEVPTNVGGIVKEIKVKLGDLISEGTVILTLEVEGEAQAPKKEVSTETVAGAATPKAAAPKERKAADSKHEGVAPSGDVYASPGVRRLAHELGVDLRNVGGTGPKNRIIKQDVFAYVKKRLSGGGDGLQVAPARKVDFAKFGEIETIPLSKINKATAVNLHRSWVTIPHVTQFEDADITEMEAFRQENKKVAADKGYKLTPLVFIMKAVVGALKEVPKFNASLDATGDNLIMKKYFHLGIAVDTPNGLVVPVVKDVDKKDIYELAKELGEISEKARDNKLTPVDMAGSCFTISSLGGIGGTAFTPIVNGPDVGILGVSRSKLTPTYVGDEIVPRLILPLSLSYDHRVIDGAAAARFIVDLSARLADVTGLTH
ncbi:MAG: 2-oxo acid dehydrogenase subunit E2 [Flavobacteriales bacterium]|nr:2-oxo acid dehydrogenase subunit E2 [Flavobacteriales bacterium]